MVLLSFINKSHHPVTPFKDFSVKISFNNKLNIFLSQTMSND